MSNEDRKEFLKSMLMIGGAAAASEIEQSKQHSEEGKKKKKKKKKKKSSNGGGGNSSINNTAAAHQTKMLRPRNFLEAALYFSTITMSTLEMGLDLEPIDFFAPPILPYIAAEDGSSSSDGMTSSILWLESLKKSYTPPVATQQQQQQHKPIMANGTEKIWNMKKSQHPKAMLVYEQHKAIQQKTLSLFSLALLQNDTPQRVQPSLRKMLEHVGGDDATTLISSASAAATSKNNSKDSSVSTKNNYFKRAIGHYAISLVDHLPPKLSDSIFSAPPPPPSQQQQNTKDKALELNDLKVPSSHTLTRHFFDVLSDDEKISLLKEEIASLQEWVSCTNKWCTCTFCSSVPRGTISVKVTLDLFYRLYLDDLVRALQTLMTNVCYNSNNNNNNNNTGKSTTTTSKTKTLTTSNTKTTSTKTIPPKKKEHLLRSLAISISRIGDDIIDEKAPFAIATISRIGKALEDDVNGPFGEKRHSLECNCHICLFKRSFGCMVDDSDFLCNAGAGGRRRSGRSRNGAANHNSDNSDSEAGSGSIDDDDDDNDDDDDDDDESFYENMNYVEDEVILADEVDLPVSPLQLTSSFPHLYDPSLYSMVSHSSVPSLAMIGAATTAAGGGGVENLGDRIADGMLIYQNLVDLLFQFSLIPSFLEEEVKEKRRELLREEENEVRRKEEKAKAKSLAKQKARERKRLAALGVTGCDSGNTDSDLGSTATTGNNTVVDAVSINSDNSINSCVIINSDVSDNSGVSNDNNINSSDNIINSINNNNNNNTQTLTDTTDNNTYTVPDITHSAKVATISDRPPGMDISAAAAVATTTAASNIPALEQEDLHTNNAIIAGLESLLLEDEKASSLSGEAPEAIISSSWFDRILGKAASETADGQQPALTEWIWSTPYDFGFSGSGSSGSSGISSIASNKSQEDSQGDLPPGIFSPSPPSNTPPPPLPPMSPRPWSPFD